MKYLKMSLQQGINEEFPEDYVGRAQNFLIRWD